MKHYRVSISLAQVIKTTINFYLQYLIIDHSAKKLYCTGSYQAAAWTKQTPQYNTHYCVLYILFSMWHRCVWLLCNKYYLLTYLLTYLQRQTLEVNRKKFLKLQRQDRVLSQCVIHSNIVIIFEFDRKIHPANLHFRTLTYIILLHSSCRSGIKRCLCASRFFPLYQSISQLI